MFVGAAVVVGATVVIGAAVVVGTAVETNVDSRLESAYCMKCMQRFRNDTDQLQLSRWKKTWLSGAQ